MSKKSKVVFSFIMLTVSVAVSVFVLIKSDNVVDYTGEQNDVIKSNTGLSQKANMESPGNDITAEHKEKYFLVIEENILCAYRIISGKKEKIASAELKSLLVDSEDIQRLKNGIYANDFEELCMYFESYTS